MFLRTVEITDSYGQVVYLRSILLPAIILFFLRISWGYREGLYKNDFDIRILLWLNQIYVCKQHKLLRRKCVLNDFRIRVSLQRQLFLTGNFAFHEIWSILEWKCRSSTAGLKSSAARVVIFPIGIKRV